MVRGSHVTFLPGVFPPYVGVTYRSSISHRGLRFPCGVQAGAVPVVLRRGFFPPLLPKCGTRPASLAAQSLTLSAAALLMSRLCNECYGPAVTYAKLRACSWRKQEHPACERRAFVRPAEQRRLCRGLAPGGTGVLYGCLHGACTIPHASAQQGWGGEPQTDSRTCCSCMPS